MQLTNIAAYVPETELSVLPPDFDALGVGPRQTLSEVESNLLGQRGWIIASSKLTKGSGKAARLARVYLADERTITAPTGHGVVPIDGIIVAYEAVGDEAMAEAPEVRAAIVQRRTFYFDAGEQVAIASLSDALVKKYGPSGNDRPGAGDGHRDFDRNGVLITERPGPSFAPCLLDENKRTVDFVQLKWIYDRPWHGSSSELWGAGFLGCGAHVEVLIREQQGTGAVDELKITLSDRDLVLNAEWAFIEARLGPEIRTAAGLANSGGTDAPEL
ncbi:MAG: hypothetical protein AAF922_12475 [Pseudomonadota bacterium]